MSEINSEEHFWLSTSDRSLQRSQGFCKSLNLANASSWSRKCRSFNDGQQILTFVAEFLPTDFFLPLLVAL